MGWHRRLGEREESPLLEYGRRMGDGDGMADRLEVLRAELREFVAEREWGKFHDPKNLSMLVASEAGELAAVLRWVDNREADAVASTEPTRSRLTQEIADVAIGLLLLCERLGVDLMEITRAKVEANRANYPVELAKGNADRPERARLE
jgi:dCTP diphosphatase